MINDTSESGHRPAWWLWYDGKYLAQRGVTSPTIDRWSFYMKTSGTVDATATAAAAG